MEEHEEREQLVVEQHEERSRRRGAVSGGAA